MSGHEWAHKCFLLLLLKHSSKKWSLHILEMKRQKTKFINYFVESWKTFSWFCPHLRWFSGMLYVQWYSAIVTARTRVQQYVHINTSHTVWSLRKWCVDRLKKQAAALLGESDLLFRKYQTLCFSLIKLHGERKWAAEWVWVLRGCRDDVDSFCRIKLLTC